MLGRRVEEESGLHPFVRGGASREIALLAMNIHLAARASLG